MRKSLKDIELPLIDKPSSRNHIDGHGHHEADHAPSGDHSHINDYDPDKIPPDFNLAKMHGIASKVYKAVSIEQHNEQESAADCPCCGLPTKGEELPLDCNLQSLYHLGCGYALYFTFLKYSIALLGVLFLVSGSYNLITNLSQDDCSATDEGFCTENSSTRLSIANKRNDEELVSTQVVLNFITVIIVIVFFHFLRYKLRKIAIEADDESVTPADYTIQLSGLPADATDVEIKEWVEAFSAPEQPIKCKKITRVYNIIEFVEQEAKKDALLKQLKAEHDYNNKLIIEHEIEKVGAKINMIKQSQDNEHMPIAFVTLTHAIMAATIAQKFKKRSAIAKYLHKVNPFTEKFELRGFRIKAKRAPEPDDVLWTNLSYTKEEKKKSRYITLGCTFLVLVVSFLAILAVYYGQKVTRGSESTVDKIFSLSVSMIICVINTILAMMIRWLTEFEKNGTKTGYSSSIAKKQSIALIINTAFTSLLAEIVLSGSSISVDEVIGGVEGLNIYGAGGLIGNMFVVFITNALYTPLLAYFDVFYYLKLFYQKMALGKGENAIMTQSEANILFEGPQMAMPNKYSIIIKAMVLTAFYAPAMPVAIIFTAVGLVMNYWTDKYLLLRRCGLPPALDNELSSDMIEYLEWTTFTFAVGNLMFLFTLVDSDGNRAYNEGHAIMILVTIAISLVHILVPMDAINREIFKINDDVTETLSYDEARGGFSTDYDIQNPMTRDHALHDLLKSVHHHHSKSKIVKLLKENSGALFSEMISNAVQNFGLEEADLQAISQGFRRNQTSKFMP